METLINFNGYYSSTADTNPPTFENGCQLVDNGVKLVRRGRVKSLKKPKININYPNEAAVNFEWDEIKIFIDYLFKEEYFCELLSSQPLIRAPVSVSVVLADASMYKRTDGKIYIDRNFTNFFQFAHELIHAIIHLNGCDCVDDLSSTGTLPCSNLNIFTDGVVGMILDLKTLFHMNYKSRKINNSGIEFDEFQLPIRSNYSPDTLDFCEQFRASTSPFKGTQNLSMTLTVISPFFNHRDNIFPSKECQKNILSSLLFVLDNDEVFKSFMLFFEKKFRDEWIKIDSILGPDFSYHNKKDQYIQDNIEYITSVFYKKTKIYLKNQMNSSEEILKKIELKQNKF